MNEVNREPTYPPCCIATKNCNDTNLASHDITDDSRTQQICHAFLLIAGKTTEHTLFR